MSDPNRLAMTDRGLDYNDRRADVALRKSFKNIADAAVGPDATQQARRAVTGTIREVVNAFKSTREKDMSEDEAIDMAESLTGG